MIMCFTDGALPLWLLLAEEVRNMQQVVRRIAIVLLFTATVRARVVQVANVRRCAVGILPYLDQIRRVGATTPTQMVMALVACGVLVSCGRGGWALAQVQCVLRQAVPA